ncbi:polya polymerase [Oribacterium sp. oral taxon 102]|uniref:polya polymerase n=1 Tax=Oribacterium sp. oral taxon 102 TaxID=671214 RepID=UPI0015B87611|nr:polya polymerase [Oribacterium sp. oral taxon 102]NWO20750.1 polya polymerase [Oribacterium sp. oral taxon 102]
MKIENVNNVEGLFNVLNSCEGLVELVSREGDRINLKSKLSQMLMMSKMLDTAYIKELELIVHEPQDMKRVVEFMMSDAHTS